MLEQTGLEMSDYQRYTLWQFQRVPVITARGAKDAEGKRYPAGKCRLGREQCIMQAMIHLQQVSKKYGEKQVLKDITQSFTAGSAIAFVGHNGCGKSTLLKVLSGLVRPTRGTVRYDRPLLFHYVPEKFPVTHLTAEQYLMHMGMIDGVPQARLSEELRKLAEDFHMAQHLQSRMSALSKGTLQKVGVIQALLVMPDVLLLDEPLSGQDVDAQKVFIEKVNDLRGRGITLFMSCHEPELVAAVAEKSYTIEQGKLLPCHVAVQETYRVLLRWGEQEDARQQAMAELTEIAGGEILPYGDGYQIQLPQAECDRHLGRILAQGWRLRGLYKV